MQQIEIFEIQALAPGFVRLIIGAIVKAVIAVAMNRSLLESAE